MKVSNLFEFRDSSGTTNDLDYSTAEEIKKKNKKN